MLLTFISAVSALMSTMSFFAYAEEPRNLDQTDPIEDLKSDPTFDINKYNFNMLGSLEIANFSEYCYSFYTDKKNDFALYIYVFNPRALKIVDSDQNKIQMAVGYDSKGNPNNYEKFNLKLCKFSSDDNYYRLFYKFKVVDHLTNGFGIYDRLSANERRYDVSGIELLTEDSGMVAPETKIATTYKFTGYAKGYGPNYEAEKSTLRCEYELLETVELDVEHTYWRSKGSNKGVGYQTQLDSVYFTVPNELFKKYGKLQRIKAEWYEYKTKDIVVTSNKKAYDGIKPYIGRSASECSFGLIEGYRIDYIDPELGITLTEADWQWNAKSTVDYPNKIVPTLYYLLPTKNWATISNYDPYGDVTLTGGVSGNALYDYIKEYSATHTENLLPIKDGKISADLFESDIDDYRKIDDERGCIKQGYSYYDFDADLDILEWETYKPEDHSFAENRKIYGFWDALFKNYDKYEDLGFDASNVSPILMLKDSYLTGSASSVSDNLYVGYNDIEKIKSMQELAKTKDETVVLFRFANTDYYSREITIGHRVNGYTNNTEGEAYRAQQSVFFDFDIIQLTFSDEGEFKIIPVVSTPMDIINDLTPGNKPTKISWWDKFVNFLKTIGAWAITIVGCCLGVGFILVIISAVTKILDARMHIAIKIIFIAPLAVLTLIVGIVVVPWVVNLVQSLGGL